MCACVCVVLVLCGVWSVLCVWMLLVWYSQRACDVRNMHMKLMVHMKCPCIVFWLGCKSPAFGRRQHKKLLQSAQAKCVHASEC